MNIEKKLNELSQDKRIKRIIKRVSDNKYSSLSFMDKVTIYQEFNTAINNKFYSLYDLHINNSNNSNYYGRSATLYEEEFLIIINGLDKNPYLYLKDILLCHLIESKYKKDDSINIGRVSFNTDYKDSFPNISLYSKDYFYFIKLANRFMDTLLKDISSPYKFSYLADLDKSITKEGLEELEKVNEIIDVTCKENIFDDCYNINKEILSLLSKKTLSKKDLALLSLDEVLNYYSFVDLNSKDSIKYNPSELLNKFIKEYFKEYASSLHVSIKDGYGPVINKHHLKSNEIFMDVLMQEIALIDSKSHLSDRLISDEMFNKFNKDGGYSKLDCYFYYKLALLDKYLKNRNLELINYVEWTKIFKSYEKSNLFKDKIDPFEELLNNKIFINTCQEYLTNNKNSSYLLNKIFSMMNEAYYNSDFKLILNNDVMADSALAEANDRVIELNVKNNENTKEILTTLFHEYRHLMQDNEIENNHQIFNDYILEHIKLNSLITPFGNDYHYASSGVECGYSNYFMYLIQPMEYDAEYFSEEFTKKIVSRFDTPINIDYNRYFSNTYRGTKYIDTDKLSIEAYSNYLKLDKISETYDEEVENYNYLMNKINSMETIYDAIEVFKFKQFDSLKLEDKIEVYRIIGEGKIDISYCKEKETIKLNNKEYNIGNESSCSILEKILLIKANNAVKNKIIKQSEIAEYVYKESRRFKADDINVYNCNYIYSYHKTFDKYYRLVRQTLSVSSKKGKSK